MKNLHYGHCLAGLALAAVVLVALGTSASTLAVLAAALACPLMMIVMMRSMAGGHRGAGTGDEPVEQHRTR